jgi:hypothetical protein
MNLVSHPTACSPRSIWVRGIDGDRFSLGHDVQLPNNEKDGGLWVMKGSSKLFPELIKAFGLEDVSRIQIGTSPGGQSGPESLTAEIMTSSDLRRNASAETTSSTPTNTSTGSKPTGRPSSTQTSDRATSSSGTPVPVTGEPLPNRADPGWPSTPVTSPPTGSRPLSWR